MYNLKSSIEINSSVSEIFALISDYSHDWKWRTRRIDILNQNDSNLEEKTTIQKYFPFLNFKINNQYRVIDFTKNSYIIFQFRIGNIDITDYRRTLPLANNRVQFEHNLKIKFIGIWKIISGLLMRGMQQDFNRDLFWLKEMLEKMTIPEFHENYSSENNFQV